MIALQHVWQEVQLHWPEISAVLLFVVSEYLGTNPNSKYDSILQALIPKLRSSAQPEIDKLQGK